MSLQALSPDTDKLFVEAILSRQLVDPAVVAATTKEYERNLASGSWGGSVAQILCSRGHLERHVAAHLLRAVRAERALDTTLALARGTKRPTPKPRPTGSADERSNRVGPYEIQGELGRGGMGVVYRAFDTRIRRPVALKMILDPSAVDTEDLERFQREARAGAKVAHPGIVQVYDAGVHDGKPFIVMELVEGISFEALLRGDEPVTPRRTAEIVMGVAEALHHAHERGVVHRDVKPQNVLLDAEGRPHLADFGLARDQTATANLTMTGSILGTPAYLAPEQARGDSREQGPHTDVYALGAVLYRALVGRPPFEAPHVNALLLKIFAEEPEAPRKLRPQLHADLETIALRCLAKEPDRRYPSAAAVAADLKHFLDGEAIVGRPVSRLERLARRVRRHPRVSVLLAAIALLAPAGLWLSVHQSRVRGEKMVEEARQRALEEDMVATRDRLTTELADLERTILSLGANPLERTPPGHLYDLVNRIVALGNGCAALPIPAPTRVAQGEWDVTALRDRAFKLALRVAAITRQVDEFPTVAKVLSVASKLRPADRAVERELQAVARVSTPAVHLEYWRTFETAKARWTRAHDLADARKGFQDALSLNPLAVLPWFKLAGMSMDVAEIDRALKETASGLALVPDHLGLHLLRALAHWHRRDLASARREYDEALRIDPSCLEAHHNLASLLYDLRQYDDALREAAFVEAMPEFGDWKMNRGIYARWKRLRGSLYYALGDMAAADRELTISTDLVPDDLEVYAWRGLARATLGRKEEALADLRRYQKSPDTRQRSLNEAVRQALEDLTK